MTAFENYTAREIETGIYRPPFAAAKNGAGHLLPEVSAPRALGQPREVASDGSAWVQLASVACCGVILSNGSGTDFEIRRDAGGTVFLPLPNGLGKNMDVVSNSNELYVRRKAAGASAAVQYECAGEAV